MKRQLLIVFALLFSILGYSEGIEFENGSWKQVLAKAKQTNKPIFVDVYATWCGPCKTMSNFIFTEAKVGRIYNGQFICYQANAEMGDGFAIAREYQVKAYPTYLFIKPDGTLIYRSQGSMEAESFIRMAGDALSKLPKEPQPGTISDEECIRRANDTTFLRSCINKNNDNAILLDQYLKLIPENERTNRTVVKLYEKVGSYLTVNSFAYANLLKNIDVFVSKLSDYVYSYLLDGVMNTVRIAAQSKDKKLMATTMSTYKLLPLEAKYIHSFEIYMQYYKKTGEIDRYMNYANKFCNNYLVNLSPDSIEKEDKANVRLFEKQINSGAFARIDSTQFAQLTTYLKLYEKETQSFILMGDSSKYLIYSTNFGNNPFLKISSDSIAVVNQAKNQFNSDGYARIDSTQLNQIKKYLAHFQRNKISGCLNDAAWETFKSVSDQKVLGDALLWSKHSLEIYPNNPFFLETYANLLYKLDKKKEAIAKEKEALSYVDKKNVNLKKRIKNTLTKMKAGE